MLSGAQIRYVEPFLGFCPDAHRLRELVLQFRGMLRWQKVDKLAGWIDELVASKFLFVGQFAKTLRRDSEAVRMAISTRWNNGPLEGQVNRLKTLKRQMYGRAGFELLRARVLPWEPCRR